MSMSMSMSRKDQRESVLHCDVEETDSGNTGYDVDIDIEGEEKRREEYITCKNVSKLSTTFALKLSSAYSRS